MIAEWDSWSNDQAIVNAVIQGDRKAAEAFYGKFKSLINGIAWRFATNAEDAKDLCQDLWVHLFLSLPRWRPSGALGGWVTTIAVNKALEWRRRKGGKVGYYMEALLQGNQGIIDTSADPLLDTEQREIQEAVINCLERIGNINHQRALKLFLQDYSYKEISSILNIPEKTVGTWICRGKIALKKCINTRLPDFFGPSHKTK